MKLPLTLLAAFLVAFAGLYVFLSQGGDASQQGSLAPDAPPAGSAVGEEEATAQLEGGTPQGAGSAEPGRTAATTPGASGAGAQAAELATWSGRVVDTAGARLAGAQVQLVQGTAAASPLMLGRPPGQVVSEAESGADGGFTLRADEAPAEGSLVVRLRGYVVRRQPASPGDLGDIVLERGMIVSGIVLNASGDPVEQARVIASDDLEGGVARSTRFLPGYSGEGVTRTDAEGRFELPHVAASTTRLDATHDVHPPAVHSIEGLAGDTLDETIRFSPAATLRGRVVGVDASETSLQAVATPKGSDSRNWAAEGTRQVDVEDDGSFELAGLLNEAEYEVWAREGNGGRGACTDTVEAQAFTDGGQILLSYREGAEVVFQVVDAATGEPIEELEVHRQWEGEFSLTLTADGSRPLVTYPEGQVTLGPLRPDNPPANLDLKVGAEGYETLQLTPSIPATGRVDLGQLRLIRTRGVVVRVRDSNGQPVAGARVKLGRPSPLDSVMPDAGTSAVVFRSVSITSSGAGGELDDLSSAGWDEADTDAEGLARFSRPEQDAVKLRVAAEGFAPFSENDVRFAQVDEARHDAVLSTGGGVLLRVVDADGEPAPGVRVEEHEAEGEHTADAAGIVELERLHPGTRYFRVADEPETPASPRSCWAATRRKTCPSGSASWSPRARSPRPPCACRRRARSKAWSAAQGEPVRNARLRLTPASEDAADPMAGALESLNLGGGETARTDRRGRYAFDSIEAGAYALKVVHPDWAMPQEFDVEIAPGGNVREIELAAAIVQVRVLDAAGEPVAGARVQARRDDGNSRSTVRIGIGGGGALLGAAGGGTDAAGRCEVWGVAPNMDLILEVTAPGKAPTISETFRVLPDGVRDLGDLVLQQALTLTVEVPGDEGGLRFVSATGEDGSAPRAKHVEAGRVVFDDLTPGTWNLRLTIPNQPGEPLETEEVVLQEGEDRTITLDGEVE